MQKDIIPGDTRNLIATDRIEGAPVRNTDGVRIGMVKRLMIDKLTGNVAYAVLSSRAPAGSARRHLPVAWTRLTYDRKLKAYRLDLKAGLSEMSASESSKFDGWDWDGGLEIQDKVKAYWGIAENW
jgi:sporulation protein YlmC with PRC-barrel domain